MNRGWRTPRKQHPARREYPDELLRDGLLVCGSYALELDSADAGISSVRADSALHRAGG
jgi:hypothetical protein